MNPTLKIPSKELKCLILIKMLGGTEQKALLEELIVFIKDLKEHTPIEKYHGFLVTKLIANIEFIVEQRKKQCEEDDLVFVKSVLDTYLYKSICKCYPSFQLESICSLSNTNDFLKENKADVIFIDGQPILKSLNPHLANLDKVKVEPKISLAQINLIGEKLKQSIIGQDKVITKLINLIKLKEAGLKNHASAFLVGRTGTGKSLISKFLGKYYANNNFFKIDCSTLTEGHEKATFLGTPPGYVGHTEDSLLAEKAKISNKWIFLFDEIEKAHPKFFDNILGLLDDGVIRDNVGKELDFSKSLFLFTSNNGIIYQEKADKIGLLHESGVEIQSDKSILSNLKSDFKMEFINRLDEILILENLTKQDILKIIALELKKYPVKVNKKAMNKIADESFSDEFGARNVNRYIQSNIGLLIADEILKLDKYDNQKFTIRLSNGQFTVKPNTDTVVTEKLQAQGGTDVTSCAVAS